MKKILLLCAALAVLLCSCKKDEPANSVPPTATVLATATVAAATRTPSPAPAPTPTATSWTTEEGTLVPSSLAPSAEPVPSESAEPAPVEAVVPRDVPSDEAVLTAYREASQATSWFAGYGQPELDEKDQKSEGETGAVYYRVTQTPLTTMDSLRAYLKDLFSDELVDGYLASDQMTAFREFDGKLYALPAGRGTDITKGGVITAVVWPQGVDVPASCTVHVTVDVVDPENNFAVTGQMTYDFPYQKVGSKWVFTQFQTIF